MTAPTARTTLVAISHLFLTDQRMGLAQLFCIGPSVVEASACRSRPSGGIHGTSAVGLDVIWNSLIRFRCSQDGASHRWKVKNPFGFFCEGGRIALKKIREQLAEGGPAIGRGSCRERVLR